MEKIRHLLHNYAVIMVQETKIHTDNKLQQAKQWARNQGFVGSAFSLAAKTEKGGASGGVEARGGPARRNSGLSCPSVGAASFPTLSTRGKSKPAGAGLLQSPPNANVPSARPSEVAHARNSRCAHWGDPPREWDFRTN